MSTIDTTVDRREYSERAKLLVTLLIAMLLIPLGVLFASPPSAQAAPGDGQSMGAGHAGKNTVSGRWTRSSHYVATRYTSEYNGQLRGEAKTLGISSTNHTSTTWLGNYKPGGHLYAYCAAQTGIGNPATRSYNNYSRRWVDSVTGSWHWNTLPASAAVTPAITYKDIKILANNGAIVINVRVPIPSSSGSWISSSNRTNVAGGVAQNGRTLSGTDLRRVAYVLAKYGPTANDSQAQSVRLLILDKFNVMYPNVYDIHVKGNTAEWRNAQAMWEDAVLYAPGANGYTTSPTITQSPNDAPKNQRFVTISNLGVFSEAGNAVNTQVRLEITGPDARYFEVTNGNADNIWHLNAGRALPKIQIKVKDNAPDRIQANFVLTYGDENVPTLPGNPYTNKVSHQQAGVRNTPPVGAYRGLPWKQVLFLQDSPGQQDLMSAGELLLQRTVSAEFTHPEFGIRTATTAQNTIVDGVNQLSDRISVLLSEPGMAWPKNSSGTNVGFPITSTLYGPLNAIPTRTTLPPSGTPVHATQTISVNAVGNYVTTPVAAPRPGYYVYRETMPANVTYNVAAYASDYGIVQETALVPWNPTLTTTRSAAAAFRGQQIHDRIRIEGAQPNSTVRNLTATLYYHGETSPSETSSVPSTATQIHRITGINVAINASGVGVADTPSWTLPETSADGYYTWVVSVPAQTDSAGRNLYLWNNEGTSTYTSPYGVPSETFRIVDSPSREIVVETQISTTDIVPGGTVSDQVTADFYLGAPGRTSGIELTGQLYYYPSTTRTLAQSPTVPEGAVPVGAPVSVRLDDLRNSAETSATTGTQYDFRDSLTNPTTSAFTHTRNWRDPVTDNPIHANRAVRVIANLPEVTIPESALPGAYTWVVEANFIDDDSRLEEASTEYTLLAGSQQGHFTPDGETTSLPVVNAETGLPYANADASLGNVPATREGLTTKRLVTEEVTMPLRNPDSDANGGFTVQPIAGRTAGLVYDPDSATLRTREAELTACTIDGANVYRVTTGTDEDGEPITILVTTAVDADGDLIATQVAEDAVLTGDCTQAPATPETVHVAHLDSENNKVITYDPVLDENGDPRHSLVPLTYNGVPLESDGDVVFVRGTSVLQGETALPVVEVVASRALVPVLDENGAVQFEDIDGLTPWLRSFSDVNYISPFGVASETGYLERAPEVVTTASYQQITEIVELEMPDYTTPVEPEEDGETETPGEDEDEATPPGEDEDGVTPPGEDEEGTETPAETPVLQKRVLTGWEVLDLVTVRYNSPGADVNISGQLYFIPTDVLEQTPVVANGHVIDAASLPEGAVPVGDAVTHTAPAAASGLVRVQLETTIPADSDPKGHYTWVVSATSPSALARDYVSDFGIPAESFELPYTPDVVTQFVSTWSPNGEYLPIDTVAIDPSGRFVNSTPETDVPDETEESAPSDHESIDETENKVYAVKDRFTISNAKPGSEMVVRGELFFIPGENAPLRVELPGQLSPSAGLVAVSLPVQVTIEDDGTASGILETEIPAKSQPGYYSWRLHATSIDSLNLNYVSDIGIPEETGYLRPRPVVSTNISHSTILPNDEISDEVIASNLEPGESFDVIGTLYHHPETSKPVPVTVVPQGATAVGRANLTLTADEDGNATGDLPEVAVEHDSGYYTWVVHIPGTERIGTYTSRYGIDSETGVLPFDVESSTVAGYEAIAKAIPDAKPGELGETIDLILKDEVKITGIPEDYTPATPHYEPVVVDLYFVPTSAKATEAMYCSPEFLVGSATVPAQNGVHVAESDSFIFRDIVDNAYDGKYLFVHRHPGAENFRAFAGECNDPNETLDIEPGSLGKRVPPSVPDLPQTGGPTVMYLAIFAALGVIVGTTLSIRGRRKTTRDDA